jgi:HAD superfamily hydrolase (TIGR01509 family)
MALIRVFDLGNVLLFVKNALFFERVRPRCRPGCRLEEAFPEYYDRARIDRGGDFEALHEELVRDLGLKMDCDELREAWNDIFAPNPPMLEVVRESPRPRYLLSNTNAPHVEWIRERYPDIFPLFDGCVLSNEVGVRKPDAAIYRHVESLSGQPAERHVFIDDIPEFVAGARAVGWQAIQFQGVEDCLKRLAAMDGGAGQA